jgi:aldehyde dehydrogenase (NAD+)
LIADLIAREVGKPIAEARSEVQRGIDILRYYAGAVMMPDGDVLASSTTTGVQYTRRHPLGVVAVITPWNFPLAIPLWKLVPAIAWGNAVILKPASAALMVGRALVEVLKSCLPDDLVQCVLGDGDVVRALIENSGIAGVSFTGSTRVGRSLIAETALRGIPCQAEMGGSNASIVLADADLPRTAATIASSAMAFAGQKCTATSRVIVVRCVYDEFLDRLRSAVSDLAVGDPAAEETVVGPVISASARTSALDAVSASEGSVLLGGTALDPGYLMAPTLVQVSEGDPLMEEEVFAPVSAVVSAQDTTDAFRIAQDSKYGLSASIFTQDLGDVLNFVATATAGMMRVNAPTTGVDYWAPFGGIRSSAFGPREQGISAREFYTHTTTVMIDR